MINVQAMIYTIRDIVELVVIGFFAIPLLHYCWDFWLSDWSEIHGHHCSHCPWKVAK